MYWKTIWIPQILGAVFGGVFVFRLGRSKTPEILLHTMEEFTGMIRESKGYTGWAEKTERKLIRNGAKYHFGKTITPMKYLTGRIVLAFLGAISLLKIGCGYAVLAATVLYFLPELLLIYMNERDNRNMLTEIKLIYQALEVQIRAGIYVADALTECCQSVKGRRLQQALIELAGDLVMQSDLMTALSAFQGKFDNRQIDALCITLIQTGESGQAVELLGDMGEQLKDMEITVLNHQKNALDRSITFYQLGMLGATLGVILYACVGYMFRAAVKF